MKYFIIFIMITNAMAFMTAKEARKRENLERATKERACVQSFRDNIQNAIDEATALDNNYITTDCYTCVGDLELIVKELQKLEYRVEKKECQEATQKCLLISW
jgi:hypothetical protein